MPDSNKPAEQSAAPKAQVPASQPRQGNSGQTQEPGSGMQAAVAAQHKARTEVPGHPGIDARLDNRTGAQRPPLEQWPAKPQQIDGPDVAHQDEHTRATFGKAQENLGPRKGAFSIGSHGLGNDEDLREGRAVQGPDEG